MTGLFCRIATIFVALLLVKRSRAHDVWLRKAAKNPKGNSPFSGAMLRPAGKAIELMSFELSGIAIAFRPTLRPFAGAEPFALGFVS